LAYWKTRNKEKRNGALIKACKELKLKEGLILTEDDLLNETVEGIKINFIPLWKWLLEK